MVRFGVQLWQEEFDYEGLKNAWREVENMGYDSAWIYDHFYPMAKNTSRYIFEAWTLLPLLAAETEKLRLGVLVSCNSYRYPSVLAKIAATVDVISNGRLEFGIGAGWHKGEHDAYGIDFPSAKTRVKRLSEAIELIKRIWTEEKASFEGKYYKARNLISYPKPLQKPYPPVWIGGKSNRLLEVAAQHADYANLAQCSVEQFRERLEALRRKCVAVGRDFSSIEKTWHGIIIVAEEREAKRRALQYLQNTEVGALKNLTPEDFLERIIAGTPEQCVDKIEQFVDLGATYFIPHFPFVKELDALRVFIEEIASSFV